MEELKKMLEEKFPNIDFDAEKALVSGGVLDSLQVVEIIGEIEDMFDISVTMEYIQPDYFESVETMWDMIEELQ
ncbi:MAG: acyl carrier protein [Lachnospiraceae bacterium]|nr:acyl carrier protein [Lachnospiraceae bacterium]MBQ4068496.1 acyl carrier protein [Lachnospiraceae bacterium]